MECGVVYSSGHAWPTYYEAVTQCFMCLLLHNHATSGEVQATTHLIPDLIACVLHYLYCLN